MKYKNPIIPGYNPDPTICRVGEDYYICNSSFEYFPGVPIYHSRNLANWELIGYCLNDAKDLPLEKCAPSGGIFAPTLRYHDGLFYMCTTNVSYGGNFVIHSESMTGEWSSPAWVDQEGIDPSLLFDEDGKVYFCTAVFDEGREGIYMSEIDPLTGRRLTDVVRITTGCGGRYAEGPHLYKWFGKYYLMLAEGGTEYGHMETIMRSDSPYGPFEPCPHNPIITHRDTMIEGISCVGHADMVEDHNGNWWLVSLGIRPITNARRRVLLHNLGRETFLTPVVWDENGWPVVGQDKMTAFEMDGPLPAPAREPDWNFADDFTGELSLEYNYLRNPRPENYELDQEKGVLRLKGCELTLNDVDTPTFIGIRQREFDACARTRLSVAQAAQGMRLGLTAFYNNSYHYEIYLTAEGPEYKICLAKRLHDLYAVVREIPVERPESVELQITADRECYRFSFRTGGGEWVQAGEGLTAGLCSEGTEIMTFTGVYFGMFAEKGTAEFEEFSVKLL